MMTKSIFEETAADKSQIGFEYQDLVCLEYLIQLTPGECVGLEVIDDVSHERIDGKKSLIQVKHTVSDKSTISNQDSDLWKTLYIWAKSLEELGGSDIEFIFYTNKKKTKRKGFVNLLSKDIKDIGLIEDEISEIKKKIDIKENEKKSDQSVNPIKKYVDYIYEMPSQDRDVLLSNIKIVEDDKEIYERLRKSVEYFSIRSDDSLYVVDTLVGVFKRRKYEIVKSNNKVLIEYDAFRKDYQFDRIILMTQDRKIDFGRYYSFKDVNSIDPKSGVFAQQLHDIDIQENEILEYAIEYANTSMFIHKMIVSGELSDIENRNIDEEVKSGWSNVFRKNYRSKNKLDEESHKEMARNCLYETTGLTIEVSNSKLVRPMVEGKGMELSDRCLIGWRNDWLVKYKEK